MVKPTLRIYVETLGLVFPILVIFSSSEIVFIIVVISYFITCFRYNLVIAIQVIFAGGCELSIKDLE